MRRTTTLVASLLPLTLLAFAPSTATIAADGDATATEEASGTELVTPDPIEVAFHLHGDDATPTIDDDYVATLGGPPLVMDRTPGDAGESRQLLNYVGGPNTQCTGNNLFPTWSGYIGDGTIASDATLTLDVTGALGGTVNVAVWADVTGQNCNEAYIQPDALTTAALPVGNGTLEVTVPLEGIDPDFSLLLMVYPDTADPTAQGRVHYDDGVATLTFTCQPDDVATAEEAADADCMPF